MAKGEIYYWIAAIAVILLIAVYIRYYYNQRIDVGISFAGPENNSVYIYQKANMTIYVINNGSAFSDFDLGVMINGNLSNIYNISLAAGKEAKLTYTHTFGSVGIYNFTVVGDPAGLYGLANRNSARAQVSYRVMPSDPADPASLLPRGSTNAYAANMSALGYAFASYLYANYSVGQLGISGPEASAAFLYPILNLTRSDVANISYAGAVYPKGEAFSLWFSGYVNPSIINVAAEALNLTTKNVEVGTDNVSVVSLSANTTLCAWYAGGWTKTLSYEGNLTCASVLEAGNEGVFVNATLPYILPSLNNSAEIGNTSMETSVWRRKGRLEVLPGTGFLYASLWKNITQNLDCYGIIYTENGVSYCSTYIEGKGVSITGNTSVLRTTAYVGEYNATVFSLGSSSNLFAQEASNINYIQRMALSGTPQNFTGEVSNGCSFPSLFSCYNLTYGNGTVSFSVRNIDNSSVNIRSAYCYVRVEGASEQMNITLVPGAAATLQYNCYEGPIKLSGIALGLNLVIGMNYSLGGKPAEIAGKAYVV